MAKSFLAQRLIGFMRFAAVAAGRALVERGALAVLAAARQARPAGVRRAVPGRDPAQMVVRRRPLALPVMRLPCLVPACSDGAAKFF